MKTCSVGWAAGFIGLPRQRSLLDNAVRDADVVHVHGLWSPLYVAVGRAAQRAGVPYFFSTHGLLDRRAMAQSWRKATKKRLAVQLFRYPALLRKSAGLVYGSAAEVAQSWSLGSGITEHVVPNGADVSLGTVAPTDEERARLLAAVPALADWRRVILCRSRIYPTKGLARMVAAFEAVAETFPDTGLLLAGLAQDPGHQRELEAIIAASPVTSRIALTTQLTGAGSQFIYQCASIFAAPSDFEGFSMAIVEGLANGRPQLITRFCHMDAVAEVGAGVIVEPSVTGVVEGLRQLLRLDDANLSVMGLRARRLFEDRYTWPGVADELTAMYRAALGKGVRS
jgi:glycosyltransferase involved in cell wall biosynthesis